MPHADQHETIGPPPHESASGGFSAGVIAQMQRWCLLWNDGALLSAVHISFSRHLRRSLGRAVMTRVGQDEPKMRVTLNASLEGAPEPLLLEVLCHELAHIAAWRAAHNAGIAIRPHGNQWQQLVSMTGQIPRLGHCGSRRSPDRQQRVAELGGRGAHRLVRHTCPVCHMVRDAKRAVRKWRCAACFSAGLAGILDIELIETSK